MVPVGKVPVFVIVSPEAASAGETGARKKIMSAKVMLATRVLITFPKIHSVQKMSVSQSRHYSQEKA